MPIQFEFVFNDVFIIVSREFDSLLWVKLWIQLWVEVLLDDGVDSDLSVDKGFEFLLDLLTKWALTVGEGRVLASWLVIAGIAGGDVVERITINTKFILSHYLLSRLFTSQFIYQTTFLQSIILTRIFLPIRNPFTSTLFYLNIEWKINLF